jgi:hypothetical protein
MYTHRIGEEKVTNTSRAKAQLELYQRYSKIARETNGPGVRAGFEDMAREALRLRGPPRPRYRGPRERSRDCWPEVRAASVGGLDVLFS